MRDRRMTFLFLRRHGGNGADCAGVLHGSVARRLSNTRTGHALSGLHAVLTGREHGLNRGPPVW
ncbi:TPA: hypothetical protein ACIVL5_004721, partial [Salmonella enterica subsp. diarizonae serovar 61:r:-]